MNIDLANVEHEVGKVAFTWLELKWCINTQHSHICKTASPSKTIKLEAIKFKVMAVETGMLSSQLTIQRQTLEISSFCGASCWDCKGFWMNLWRQHVLRLLHVHHWALEDLSGWRKTGNWCWVVRYHGARWRCLTANFVNYIGVQVGNL